MHHARTPTVLMPRRSCCVLVVPTTAGLKAADAEWEARSAEHRGKHDYHTKADQLRRMLRRLKDDPCAAAAPKLTSTNLQIIAPRLTQSQSDLLLMLSNRPPHAGTCTSRDKGSVWDELLSSQTERRVAPVSRSRGVVLGEHAALFGRCSASVWATSVVETLCIEAKAFYEFVVLVRAAPLRRRTRLKPAPMMDWQTVSAEHPLHMLTRPRTCPTRSSVGRPLTTTQSPSVDFSREWLGESAWVEAMLSRCATELEGAQVTCAKLALLPGSIVPYPHAHARNLTHPCTQPRRCWACCRRGSRRYCATRCRCTRAAATPGGRRCCAA